MRRQLEVLLPEFQLIQAHELREKTIEVWVEALRESGWTLDDLQAMPFTLLIPDTEINLLTHTRAVTLCALRMAEIIEQAYRSSVKIDRDILLSGALLHDVGKLFEIQKKEGKFVRSHSGELVRHPVSGAAFASRFGLPQEVLHIIAAHSREGDTWKRTVEAIIVNHADFVNFDILKH